MSSIASRNELRFTSLLGGIFVVLGSILEGFGEAKWKPKLIFWKFFLDVFLDCVFIDLGWIFGGSKPEKSIKTIGFSMVFAHFQKIDVFEKSAKKPRFWSRFRKPKP